MKRWAKKIVVYSTIAAMQLGLGAAVTEASPGHDNQRFENHHHQGRFEHRDNHEREQRMHAENERHEREMQRRHYEREHEWHERQRLEKERHEQALNTILGIAIICAILDK